MDIYFYCTYEHSMTGFFPTYLTPNGLIPADGSGGVEMPQNVWDFFSFDRFKLIWREYSGGGKAFLPTPEHGMIGIRRIEGDFGGRSGVINIAVTAGEEELRQLENAVAVMIGAYADFLQMLLRCISVGGECGYQIDAEGFYEYMRCADDIDFKTLESTDGGKMIADALKRESGIFTERDLLRFAVTSEPWSEIRDSLGGGFVWKRKPKCVITPDEFERKFLDI